MVPHEKRAIEGNPKVGSTESLSHACVFGSEVQVVSYVSDFQSDAPEYLKDIHYPTLLTMYIADLIHAPRTPNLKSKHPW